jgi:hypothetical protein
MHYTQTALLPPSCAKPVMISIILVMVILPLKKIVPVRKDSLLFLCVGQRNVYRLEPSLRRPARTLVIERRQLLQSAMGVNVEQCTAS